MDLQAWMVEDHDVEVWGARVENTSGIERGSFKSLCHAQNNFGYYFIIGFIGG